MGALALGPLVLSLDRALAGLGFVVLLLGAEIIARRTGPAVATWGWHAALATFLGARLGFVIENISLYATAPATVLAIWQGGFAPWWGVAAAFLVTLWHAVRAPQVRSVAPGLALVALAAWWLPASLMTQSAALATVALPAVTLPALEGEPVALAEVGQPRIVNVWATWCPPCRRELPVLFAAAERNPEVAVLLVNQRESERQVRDYLTAAGFPAAGVLLDERGVVGGELQVAGLPTTLAFDAAGRLVSVHVGEISAPALQAMISALR